MGGKICPTYVYVIGLLRLDDCCKIGVSKDPDKRVSEISTGTPFVPVVAFLELMATGGQARAVERASHKSLESFRANGEWFWVSPHDAWTKVVQPIAKRINTYREPREYEKIERKIFPTEKLVIPKSIEEMVSVTANIKERLKAKSAV